MATRPLHKTLAPLRQLAASQFFADWPDRRLLERFLAQRDEAAFAELVHRHRRLVWGLCRHLLRHEQDAEDAFQATFLVLALRGRSIHRRQALPSWLHGVAYRCAMHIKRYEARRLRREQQTVRDSSCDPAAEAEARELAALLETEVQRLPEKHRAPFVLCCLEGKSQEDAARALGWKTGTLSGRLARARQELQRRLGRTGVQLPAALTAAALGEIEVSAAVVAATVRGGLAALSGTAAMTAAISPNVLLLVKGVTQAVFLNKIKTAIVAFLLAGLVAGVGLTAQQAIVKKVSEEPRQAARDDPKEPPASAKSPRRDPDLRYDGKPFEYWRDFTIKELKAERRIDAIRAMGAFGTRGYATEGAEVIVNVMKEYQDTSTIWSALASNTSNPGTPDERVVSEAYAALHKIGPAAAPVLLKNLGPQNLRTFAVLGFRHGGVPLPKSSLPVLARLIAHGEGSIPSAALEILSDGREPKEERWRAIAFSAKTDGDEQKMVKALTRVVAEDQRAFTGIVFDKMWYPRDVAAYLLGRMGMRAREAGPTLVKAALEGQSEAARTAVSRVKPDPQVVVALAMKALQEKSNINRSRQQAAAELLGDVGPEAKRAVPLLVAALPAGVYPQGPQGPQNIEAVRRGLTIFEALEKIGGDKRQVVPALAKVLVDKKQDPNLQAAALKLLRKVESNLEPLVPALAGCLTDLSVRGNFGSDTSPPWLMQFVRPAREIMEIFQELGPKAEKAMPALQRVFKGSNREIQLAVVTTWAKMGSAARDALPVLYQLLAKTADTEETRTLRQEASDAIRAMSRQP
jgi:RNA polymerase sigma factor (sigma-70 family)